MGCTSSKSAHDAEKGKGPFLLKEAYKGEMTATSKNMIDMEAEWLNALPDGSKCLVPEGMAEIREGADAQCDEEFAKPYWAPYVEKCEVTEHKYNNSAGEATTFWEVRSKANVGKKGLPAFIDIHGGGGWSGHAKHHIAYCCRVASEVDVVFLTLDYRLGPEVKAPTGALDVKCAIEHIFAKADEFGIDNTRLSTTAVSGGSWINMVANVFIAREGKIKLKSMYLLCPMLDNNLQKRKLEDWENYLSRFGPEDFELHATDFEKQDKENDFYLFPGRISQEDAKKLPPTILQKSEFDTMRADVDEIIPKLKTAGVYSDHMDFSGVSHGFFQNSDEPKADVFYEQYIAAMKAYSGVK